MPENEEGENDDQDAAAGIVFVAPDRQALFLKRGDGGDFPGYWCFPGGHLKKGETEKAGAIREAKEELGLLPGCDPALLLHSMADPSIGLPAFTSYLQRVASIFEPKLNGEHVGFAWAPIDSPPEPLHPGCAIALARIDMDELGIARAMAAGLMTSPQKYANVWLFDIRITGTGAAYRPAAKEYVWRDPSIYLNDEFLARCNGLSVIFEHPESPTLNTEEFGDRIVGSVMLPYIKENEVWGIAKIYDEPSVKLMQTTHTSTSPGVVLGPSSENQSIALEGGTKLLIEGKPDLLDHIAICPLGVWDKGGEPSGIVSTPQNIEDSMAEESAEEKRSREDAARRDSAPEMIANAVKDSMGSVMDAIGKMSARMDAWEEKNKKDSETETAEEKAKKDADDKCRLDRAKKDADEAEERAVKDRKDASEKEEGEEKARADAQARCDSVLAAFGSRAPAPLKGETARAYRIRLAEPLKIHSPDWKSTDLRAIADDATFGVIEGKIFSDAIAAARNPSDIPEGILLEIKSRTDAGHLVTSFKGHPSVWTSEFKSPTRVAKFRTQSELRGN